MIEQTNLQAFESLKQKIDNDPVIDRYRQMANKIHQNEKILAVYDEYIQKQKQLIKFEH